MSVIANNAVESVSSQLSKLGQNQQQIKVYFNAQDEIGNAELDPTYGGPADAMRNEEAWSTDEIDTILGALADIETLIDVQFVVTTDKSEADIDLVKNDDIGSTTGYVSHFLVDDGDEIYRASTIVINHTISSLALYRSPWSGGYEIGTYGYQVLLTMLGGALGLALPYSDTNGSKILPGLSPTTPFARGPDGLNDTINSVMAQGIGWDKFDTVNFQSGARGTFGAWDIAALQAKYGAVPDTNPGDTVYTLTDNFISSPSYFKTIYDTGGEDWIVAGNSLLGIATRVFSDVQIDLRAATLDFDPVTSGGPVSFTFGAGNTVNPDGFTIAFGTIIENARGDFGDDTLIGNHVANILEGQEGDDLFLPGLGADTMDGGAGTDEYAGTVEELFGDTILNIEGNDRVSSCTASATRMRMSRLSRMDADT